MIAWYAGRGIEALEEVLSIATRVRFGTIVSLCGTIGMHDPGSPTLRSVVEANP